MWVKSTITQELILKLKDIYSTGQLVPILWDIYWTTNACYSGCLSRLIWTSLDKQTSFMLKSILPKLKERQNIQYIHKFKCDVYETDWCILYHTVFTWTLTYFLMWSASMDIISTHSYSFYQPLNFMHITLVIEWTNPVLIVSELIITDP